MYWVEKTIKQSKDIAFQHKVNTINKKMTFGLLKSCNEKWLFILNADESRLLELEFFFLDKSVKSMLIAISLFLF